MKTPANGVLGPCLPATYVKLSVSVAMLPAALLHLVLIILWGGELLSTAHSVCSVGGELFVED